MRTGFNQFFLALAVLCVSAVAPTYLLAQEQNPVATARLSRRQVAEPIAVDSDLAGRLAYIQDLFAREERPATLWTFGWQAGFGAIAAGQALWALGAHLNDNTAVMRERGVGAAAASIGFFTQFLSWLPSRNANQQLAAMPATTPDALAQKLKRAELLLYEGYKRERFTRQVLTHLGGLAVAGGSALILWKVYDLDQQAAINFPIALSVGQLRIWTQPVLSLRGWRAYGAAYGHKQPSSVSFSLLPQPQGLVAVLSF